MVQKVPGKIQEGPRSPPDSLEVFVVFMKVSFVLNIFFNCLLNYQLNRQLNRLGFGLGDQGSWAGPAWFWLGGPRVLGRAGLALHYLNIMVLLYIIHSLFYIDHC